LITLMMLVHRIQTTIQIRAQVQKRMQMTVMKSTKRIFLMAARLAKENMTMMTRNRTRKDILMRTKMT
jgi:hypothetical protein